MSLRANGEILLVGREVAIQGNRVHCPVCGRPEAERLDPENQSEWADLMGIGALKDADPHPDNYPYVREILLCVCIKGHFFVVWGTNKHATNSPHDIGVYAQQVEIGQSPSLETRELRRE